MEIVWDEDFVIGKLDSMSVMYCRIRLYGSRTAVVEGGIWLDSRVYFAWVVRWTGDGIVIFMVAWHCGIF